MGLPTLKIRVSGAFLRKRATRCSCSWLCLWDSAIWRSIEISCARALLSDAPRDYGNFRHCAERPKLFRYMLMGQRPRIARNHNPSAESAIHPLATIGRDNGSEVYRVGGVADHVHILATLSLTVTQADLLEEIKKRSSRWIKEIDSKYASFGWQRGYGAFSVGLDELEEKIQYVEGQEEHHRTVTFPMVSRIDSAMKFGRSGCKRMSNIFLANVLY